MATLIGVSVMPEYIQQEGDRVLENLVGLAGANAIVTAPCVTQPSDAADASREPPVSGALLDRPIWGRRELKVATSPSLVHDLDLFRGQRYQPPAPTELTRREGHLVGGFLASARAAGLGVHMRIQAAAPPGYRAQFARIDPDDEPLLPDGTALPGRIDHNASLASPHIRAYLRALIIDLCRQYPQIDGFHIDWPEYPPYTLDAAFFDFSPHCRSAAGRLGLDFDRMRADVGALRAHLRGGLTDATVASLATDAWRDTALGRHLLAEGVTDWLSLKRTLCAEIVETCRKATEEVRDRPRIVSPMAFPPPWSRISGMDYAAVARAAGSIVLKLIPSHWPMMLRSYGDALAGANRALSERVLVGALLDLLDIQEPRGSLRLADYGHPPPGEAFEPGDGPQERKLRTAQREAGAVPVIPLLHSLGPEDDFRRRLVTCLGASGSGIWINRYGFLTDGKLRIIGEVTAGPKRA